MGKVRNKKHDETQYYKGLIRDLEKQVRNLKRQLKYYTKREHILNEHLDDIKELTSKKEEPILKKLKCTECNKGTLDEFMVLDRLYGTCNSCGHRKRLN